MTTTTTTRIALALIAVSALSAAGPDDPVAAADQAFVHAYEKGDMAAVKKYLDADFTRIDTDGVFYFKDDALALGLRTLVPSGAFRCTRASVGELASTFRCRAFPTER
jgi:hypothetical protein